MAASLDDLIGSNLRELLAGGPGALEESLFGAAKQDIDRQQQGLLESLFGRGMGRSTQAGPIAREVAQALARARVDAATASRQATLAALAQATGQQNRQQRESEFGRTLDANKRNSEQQDSIANRQLIAQGVGGIGGSALTLGGLLYGKELKSGLRDLFSGGRGGSPPTNMTGPGGTYGGPQFGVGPDAALEQPAVGGDYSIPDFSLDTPQFDLSSAMDPSNFDLGGGSDFLLQGLDLPTLDLLSRGWDDVSF